MLVSIFFYVGISIGWFDYLSITFVVGLVSGRIDIIGFVSFCHLDRSRKVEAGFGFLDARMDLNQDFMGFVPPFLLLSIVHRWDANLGCLLDIDVQTSGSLTLVLF
ncbi:hypothetical protein NE237_022328 [Protea cynaroides]|uniref:Uncharacterized protein n=1 Tax=Protea cynaroides TaxID=273540 RepID=A0A9Q0K3E9_9MAGN|nr:hypothetical protein NE237_022328 [Protea cynaroides]